MTQPIPINTDSRKRIDYGQAIVGYYKDGHRLSPVNVDKEGFLLFRQDSRTKESISRFAAAIESLADYFRIRIEEQEGASNESAESDLHT